MFHHIYESALKIMFDRNNIVGLNYSFFFNKRSAYNLCTSYLYRCYIHFPFQSQACLMLMQLMSQKVSKKEIQQKSSLGVLE